MTQPPDPQSPNPTGQPPHNPDPTNLNPENPAPADLDYQSTSPFGNAPTLLLLATIFNFVMAGLDFLYAIAMVGFTIFMYFMLERIAAVPPPAGGSPGPPLPHWFPLIYGAMAVPALGAAVVNLIAGLKLKRHSQGAWGWALAAAIVNCLQLWCNWGCVVPMANGIYSIIILCQPRVQAFLRARPVEPVASFPVAP